MPYDGAPVVWMHNGKQIFPEKNPAKYEIISDGPYRTLVIKNLREEEQGVLGVKIADKLTTAKLQVGGQISKDLKLLFSPIIGFVVTLLMLHH